MKLNLLYYKHLLDDAMLQFFNEYNNSFSKNENNQYVFIDDMSVFKFKKSLQQLLLQSLTKYAQPVKTIKNDIYLIIGSCFPVDNILYTTRDLSQYFPAKLCRYINQNPTIKYLLREHDILFDNNMLNSSAIDIFNSLFKKQNAGKISNLDFSNVYFVSHSKLDCYAMFKIIKQIYGKTNCVNVCKQLSLHDKMQPYVAINELVDRYINNKLAIIKSDRLQNIKQEVKQYIDSCLGF